MKYNHLGYVSMNDFFLYNINNALIKYRPNDTVTFSQIYTIFDQFQKINE